MLNVKTKQMIKRMSKIASKMNNTEIALVDDEKNILTSVSLILRSEGLILISTSSTCGNIATVTAEVCNLPWFSVSGTL